ncbi:MAG: hypothetical protein COV91_05025 [Candidatus Taylorbacteria bacterium CG11_big_fil_rev_8_21_14_0_20_46_11]|uniref:Type I restriction modification DNA specificity domain-containing protein n=1 Tax=Candidatus Taylorbacteria bacterium CG11_big_fil_rev_8_21_14_0_20_46_11 TaxID=1975025 RepID=A0A2H0KAH1_9BACT|nr:MAG: hypothetical protein COV91_05025 [Candidatus Taylorbacteria bacterium CG11_big_fil_rev_8_21_14_0_20_46_11]
MPTKTAQPKTNLIPKLRFSGFSDGPASAKAEAGNWEEKKLGEVCDYKNGGAFENNLVENGKYNLITLNSIDIDGKLKSFHKTVGKADWYLKKDDLVMVLSDVAHGNFLGLVDVIPEDNKYVLNQRMGLLRKTDEQVNLSFLRTFVNKSQRYFKLHGQGSSQQNLSKGDILKFKIVTPSLPEQQKIAGFLGAVDGWIENLRGQKESLTLYKKGMMQKIFPSKGGQVSEIRFKDDKGKNFPDWEEKKLGSVLDYEQPTDYIVESTEYDDEYKIPVLTAGKTFVLGYTNETKGIFENGKLPVIIFDDFTTASQFVDFAFKVKSSAMKILTAKSDTNIRFIYEAMQLIKYEVGGHGRHWISKFSSIKMLIPSLLEQQKIADFLTSLDKVIESKQQQITHAEQWKKGLMQGLFV